MLPWALRKHSSPSSKWREADAVVHATRSHQGEEENLIAQKTKNITKKVTKMIWWQGLQISNWASLSDGTVFRGGIYPKHLQSKTVNQRNMHTALKVTLDTRNLDTKISSWPCENYWEVTYDFSGSQTINTAKIIQCRSSVQLEVLPPQRQPLSSLHTALEHCRNEKIIWL